LWRPRSPQLVFAAAASLMPCPILIGQGIRLVAAAKITVISEITTANFNFKALIFGNISSACAKEYLIDATY